jgi:hypothetical protein
VAAPAKGSPVIPFPGTRPARVLGSTNRPSEAPRAPRQVDKGSQDLSDMEIPTFIRRQMD